MYNKYIAIITAENKEKTIAKTIRSCLNSSIANKIKIIVVYSNLYNEKFLFEQFRLYKNVIFFKVKSKKKYPTQDQLFKIQETIKFIKKEWILLLDGDDLFEKNKIRELNKLTLNKDKIYLHDHKIQFGKIKFNSKKKFYKNNLIYKKFINDWPENINTSSIVLNADLLKKFFENHKPYAWKYLAIDVQLILFYFYKKKLKYLNKILTTKIENINNLDKTFSNKKTKIYWLRRIEQHKLTLNLSGKLNFLDKIVSLFFLKIFNK